MIVEFKDLKKQYQMIKPQIDIIIAEILSEGNFILGSQVYEIERRLAEYVGVKHCITCANGTDALVMILKAWGIGAGDAVFVPDFTFFATAEAVAVVGAVPVFVDVDIETFNIDPKKLELCVIKTLQEKRYTPKAVIAVDLFGLPANYIEINRIAECYNLLVLEDGAQGFGGKIGEQFACSFGDVATTSFFPAKPLGCYGDGGAIFTGNDNLSQVLNSLKVHGKGLDKYDNVRIGYNSRLDTIQAAILLKKLEIFSGFELEHINELAKIYNDNLKGFVRTPVIPDGYYSSYAQYTIQTDCEGQRDKLQMWLKEKDIPTTVFYPKPLHLQTAFKYLGSNRGDFTISEQLCKTVLSLPIHPYLSEDEIAKICEEIKICLT